MLLKTLATGLGRAVTSERWEADEGSPKPAPAGSLENISQMWHMEVEPTQSPGGLEHRGKLRLPELRDRVPGRTEGTRRRTWESYRGLPSSMQRSPDE